MAGLFSTPPAKRSPQTILPAPKATNSVIAPRRGCPPFPLIFIRDRTLNDVVRIDATCFLKVIDETFAEEGGVKAKAITRGQHNSLLINTSLSDVGGPLLSRGGVARSAGVVLVK